MIAVTGRRSVSLSLEDEDEDKIAGKSIQGFLTSENRFVDRKEAAKIHVANGGKLNYSDASLYSEDLY